MTPCLFPMARSACLLWPNKYNGCPVCRASGSYWTAEMKCALIIHCYGRTISEIVDTEGGIRAMIAKLLLESVDQCLIAQRRRSYSVYPPRVRGSERNKIYRRHSCATVCNR